LLNNLLLPAQQHLASIKQANEERKNEIKTFYQHLNDQVNQNQSEIAQMIRNFEYLIATKVREINRSKVQFERLKAKKERLLKLKNEVVNVGSEIEERDVNMANDGNDMNDALPKMKNRERASPTKLRPIARTPKHTTKAKKANNSKQKDAEHEEEQKSEPEFADSPNESPEVEAQTERTQSKQVKRRRATNEPKITRTINNQYSEDGFFNS